MGQIDLGKTLFDGDMFNKRERVIKAIFFLVAGISTAILYIIFVVTKFVNKDAFIILLLLVILCFLITFIMARVTLIPTYLTIYEKGLALPDKKSFLRTKYDVFEYTKLDMCFIGKISDKKIRWLFVQTKMSDLKNWKYSFIFETIDINDITPIVEQIKKYKIPIEEKEWDEVDKYCGEINYKRLCEKLGPIWRRICRKNPK